MTQQSIPKITPKFVDWVLYELPVLREQIDALEPKSSTSVVSFGGSTGTKNTKSQVEKVAIKREAASAVLDAVERAIKTLHPEQRKVYRMKYRAGMKHKQIARRIYASDRTVDRRVEEVRTIVGNYVSGLSPSVLEEFARFFD